jgi:hypothetical protein
MFDVSLPWANFWYDAFNVTLFVGAFAVAVGTYGSIKMGSIKERFSDERTTALETQSEQAKAALGAAQADIAKANAQIAEANARTKEAELALARLNSPRKLTDEQMRKLVERLSSYAGNKYWIMTQKSDAAVIGEQIDFANQLNAAFARARWLKSSHTMVDQTKEQKDSTPVSDRKCFVAFNPEEKSRVLGRAVVDGLIEAGIDCDSSEDIGLVPELVFLEVGLR